MVLEKNALLAGASPAGEGPLEVRHRVVAAVQEPPDLRAEEVDGAISAIESRRKAPVEAHVTDASDPQPP